PALRHPSGWPEGHRHRRDEHRHRHLVQGCSSSPRPRTASGSAARRLWAREAADRIAGGAVAAPSPTPPRGAIMSQTPHKIYVIQGRGQRDYAECQAAVAHVPARVETRPFIGDAAEVIERTRDAAALGVERVGLDELASRADYVSVHTVLNGETHHLIG